MVENVIRKPATASVSMVGQGRRANFYAPSVSLAETVLKGATAKMEPVVTVRLADASVSLVGVVSIAKNLVPVDTMDQSARKLASVRMERFVIQ